MSELPSSADTGDRRPSNRYKQVKGPMGAIGIISRVLFWGWQMLMLIWFLYFSGSAGNVVSQAGSDWEKAGAGIGAAIGWGIILFFWAGGSIIFGLMALLTRPPVALVPDVEEPAISRMPLVRSGMISQFADRDRKAGNPAVLLVLGGLVIVGLVAEFLPSTPSPANPEPVASNSSASVSQARSDTPVRSDSACRVSMAKYNDLDMGIALEDVVRRFGCKGTVMSEVQLNGYGSTQMLSWKGATTFSQVALTFHNRQLQAKSQFGLD